MSAESHGCLGRSSLEDCDREVRLNPCLTSKAFFLVDIGEGIVSPRQGSGICDSLIWDRIQ